MPDRRVTLREASALLGVSEGAIRKRVARGTIRSEMGEDGLRYVWVPEAGGGTDDGADGGEDASSPRDRGRDELVEELRRQNEYLRGQLDVRADEIQRRDVIISQLTQATSNLTDRLRELEPAREGPEEAETVEEGPEATEPRPAAGGTQEAPQETQARPWWRRIFGS